MHLGKIVMKEMNDKPNGIMAVGTSAMTPRYIMERVEDILTKFYDTQSNGNKKKDFMLNSVERIRQGESISGVVVTDHGKETLARVNIVYYGENIENTPLVKNADFPVSWAKRVTGRRFGIYINGPENAQTRNAILKYARRA